MKERLIASWRRNPWLVSFIIFGLFLEATNLMVIQWHYRTPGSYYSPEKIQQRVLIANTRVCATLFFLGMAMWREKHYLGIGTGKHD